MKIPGVGPAYTSRLEKLGIRTDKDLLYHLPFRYDDYSVVSKIAGVQPGETVTVRGEVLEMKNIFTRSGFVLQQAKVRDETGTMEAVWFNQRFLPRVISKGDQISLSGKVDARRKMESPVYEVGTGMHTGRLVPVYPETEGVSSKWLRQRIYNFLQDYHAEDYLDAKAEGLMALDVAIHKVHFPDTLEQAREARRRLAFDELLNAQLQAEARREELEKESVGNKLEVINHREKLKKFVDNLPFVLTGAQKKVISEIYQDLAGQKPMNRLLQGDVGSGKTVVAAAAMLVANLNGLQAALMAPTEILAAQHYETLRSLQLNVGIATGSKKDNLGADIIVGTHALISDKLNFKKLGLVVIDEQHRFGVSQRAKLLEKGVNPHVLTMTATPIPRTIALTLYRDMDLSVMDELPRNRLPVKTWVVPKEKRQAAYEWIRKQNTQVFIICPFIEESETLATVKAATTEVENIRKIFPEKRVGLIHGRLKNKDRILNDFKDQKLDILVATPVVEVGIDVPTATIMVIEAAERFGLAQLHQLRGRVGRSEKQSYCLLFSEDGAQRLKMLERLHNGLALAEADLKYRGPGQRFGTAQHGHWDLKIADFSDLTLIEKAAKAAQNPLLRARVLKSKINLLV